MNPCLSNVPKSVEQPSVGNWDGGFLLISGVAGSMSNPETKKRAHQKAAEIARKERSVDSIDRKEEIRQESTHQDLFSPPSSPAGGRRPRHLGSPRTICSAHDAARTAWLPSAVLSARFLQPRPCLSGITSIPCRISMWWRLLRAVPCRPARRLRGRPRLTASQPRCRCAVFCLPAEPSHPPLRNPPP
jgi:hypothetical protein